MQFTKDHTFILRAVRVYDKEDGLKAGEPNPKAAGTHYPDGTEVVAIEAGKGGEWLCRFPDGTEARVHPNKILDSAAAMKYKQGRQATKNGASKDPTVRFKAAKAVYEAKEKELEVAKLELQAAAKALQQMAQQAKEAEAIAEQFLTETEIENEEIEDEQQVG